MEHHNAFKVEIQVVE